MTYVRPECRRGTDRLRTGKIESRTEVARLSGVHRWSPKHLQCNPIVNGLSMTSEPVGPATTLRRRVMTIDWNAVRKDIEWLEKDYDWIAAQQRQLDAMRKIIAPNLDVIQSTGEAFATMSDFVSDYNRLHAQAADAMGSGSPVPEIKVYTGSEFDWVDHVAIPEIVETSAQVHKRIQEWIDV